MSVATVLRMSRSAKLSVPSILAGVCVLLIFVTDGLDFVLGIAAVVLGALGALLALQSDVRGGFVSAFSVLIGLGAAVISVFQVLL